VNKDAIRHTVSAGRAHKRRHVTVTAERTIAFMTDAMMLTEPRWTESRCIYHTVTVTATPQHSHLSLPGYHHTVQVSLSFYCYIPGWWRRHNQFSEESDICKTGIFSK